MPATTPGMDWSDQATSTLRTLWDEGHSTAEIGRRLNVSKNAIVGKAHRLVLPPRSSPIRSTSKGHSTPPSARPPAPPPLNKLLPVSPPVLHAQAVILTATVATRAPEPPPARPIPRELPVPACGCQWPIGTPGTAEFHLCGETPMARKPYCDSHCGRAYVRLRDGAADTAPAA